MSSKPPEVTRWTEGSEAPAELRELLAVGRQQLGTRAEVATLAEGLARALGPAAGLGEGAAPVGAAVQAPLAASRWAAWFAGGVVVTGAVVWWAMGSEAPLERSAVVMVPAAPTRVPEPLPAPAAASSEPVLEAPLPDRANVIATPGAPQPASVKPARRASQGRATSAVNEAELLERAQAALSERPRDALALTTEHEQRFPRGALVQEREVIAIEALKRLGKKDAASARAAAFEDRYRGSVHQNRIER